MDKTRLFFLIWGVCNTLVQELGMALMDKVLDGGELLRITKSMIMNLRFSGISSTDLDKIKLITSASEFQALSFEDGDGAFYAPKELVEKLKINFEKL